MENDVVFYYSKTSMISISSDKHLRPAFFEIAYSAVLQLAINIRELAKGPTGPISHGNSGFEVCLRALNRSKTFPLGGFSGGHDAGTPKIDLSIC